MFLELSSQCQINYQLISGDLAKPYLVFLHEGLGSIKQWKGYPELLCEATGCPGLVYDRQGYGESSALTKERSIHYIHEYALQELPSVLSAVIPNQQYILIGHSDGGSISLIAASEQRALLQGVITEAAHVFVEDETLAGIALADQAWNEGKLTGLNKYHGEKTAQTFKAWSVTWQQSAFKYWNIEYLLPSIEVPILVIQGKDDQYGSLKQVDSIVQNSQHGSAKIIAKCAHVPHLEAQLETLHEMCGFITEIYAH
ncbi:MAG: alpha/beta hydrolase [Oceanospirillaceae bacterium]